MNRVHHDRLAKALYRIDAAGRPADASFVVLQYIDALCCQGRFDELQRCIDALDLTRISSSTRRMILCVTKKARDYDRFAGHDALYDSCWNLLSSEKGEDYARRALDTLK